MTKEEMIEIEKGWREMSAKEAIELIDERMCFGRGKWSEHHMPVKDTYWIAGEMAIKALRYEPCRDAVSRQAVIDCFCTKERYFRDVLDVIKDIRQLPPAQPDRKHGKWIYHIDDIFPAESTMECDQCHAEQPLTCDDEFCPHCGARMEGDK